MRPKLRQLVHTIRPTAFAITAATSPFAFATFAITASVTATTSPFAIATFAITASVPAATTHSAWSARITATSPTFLSTYTFSFAIGTLITVAIASLAPTAHIVTITSFSCGELWTSASRDQQ